MQTSIKPCLHCGSGKVKAVKTSKLDGFNGLDKRVEYHTYSVRCNVCHSRGPASGGKVIKSSLDIPLPEWATTDEALKERAIEAWNRRVSDEQ